MTGPHLHVQKNRSSHGQWNGKKLENNENCTALLMQEEKLRTVSPSKKNKSWGPIWWIQYQTDNSQLRRGLVKRQRKSEICQWGFHNLSWHAGSMIYRKQTEVALLTAEAEYRAMGDLFQWAVYKQTLAPSFNTRRTGILLQNDNMPGLNMVEEMGATRRSKLIDKQLPCSKEAIRRQDVKIKHTLSAELRADMFTKALERV